MDIRARILQLCEEHEISINELAMSACLTQSTVNNITSGRNKTVTLKTIEKICEGLGITLADFFEPTRWASLSPEAEQEWIEFNKNFIKKYKLK